MAPKKDELLEVDEEPEEYDELDDEDYEKKGWTFRKKFFTILIVIVVIIAAVAAVFLLNPNVKDVLIIPPREQEDGSGIIVESHALLEGSRSAEGDGTLKIMFEGQETYSSTVSFSGDYGRKEIKYNEFIWGSGEYEIVVNFGGKSASYFFDPADSFNFGIAEYVNVSLTLEPSEYELQINPLARQQPVKIYALAFIKEIVTVGGQQTEKFPNAPPRYSTLELTLDHDSGYSEKDFQVLEKNSTATFEFTYYASEGDPGPGTYTASAKIINDYVKADSSNYEINLPDIRSQYLNVAPIADAGSDKNEVPGVLQNSIEIDFDGSGSWNDGEITNYQWDFDYDEDIGFEPDQETTSPTTQHTYNQGVNVIDTYKVALMVIGDEFDPRLGPDEEGKTKQEFSFIDVITVTIRWGI